jgi:hypothetical protein
MLKYMIKISSYLFLLMLLSRNDANLKYMYGPGVVVHAYNLCTQEAEVAGSRT